MYRNREDSGLAELYLQPSCFSWSFPLPATKNFQFLLILIFYIFPKKPNVQHLKSWPGACAIGFKGRVALLILGICSVSWAEWDSSIQSWVSGLCFCPWLLKYSICPYSVCHQERSACVLSFPLHPPKFDLIETEAIGLPVTISPADTWDIHILKMASLSYVCVYIFFSSNQLFIYLFI